MKKQNKESLSELLVWLSNSQNITNSKSSCLLLDTVTDLIKHLKECVEYSNCFNKQVAVTGPKDEYEDSDDYLEDDYLEDDEEEEKKNSKIEKKKKRTKKVKE